MENEITLRPVTKENFLEVVDLELHEDQSGFLPNNAFSIAQASVNHQLRCRAICRDRVPVGFLLYAHPEEEDEEPGCYSIWRFMLDKRHQRRGHGIKAMALLLDQLRSEPDVKKIFISYLPENLVARAFYAKFGFSELCIDAESGEMEAVLIP